MYMANKKEEHREEKKQTFLDILSSMSDEEMHNYIKENGKNNSLLQRLFIFDWARINPVKNIENK